MASKVGGLKNLFVQYHKPSFSTYKHQPLGAKSDYLQTIEKLKGLFSIPNVVVFNGHNHTTEVYHSEGGVLVLVAGGGGAPQKPTEAINHKKALHPKERFWRRPGARKDGKTQLRFNYFEVKVEGKSVHLLEKCLTNAGSFKNGVTIDIKGKITRGNKNCWVDLKALKRSQQPSKHGDFQQ